MAMIKYEIEPKKILAEKLNAGDKIFLSNGWNLIEGVSFHRKYVIVEFRRRAMEFLLGDEEVFVYKAIV